ncbi:hypothetical protein V5O48_010121 [Marasmius crinis-equi]|uniref:Uncharacterized protein n=1 Tax=Marasmius crinis-equi TaxID=585013 RepID=A0ABR3F9D9_9AGAR
MTKPLDGLQHRPYSSRQCKHIRRSRAVDAGFLASINEDINAAGFFGIFTFVPVIDGAFVKRRLTEDLKQGKFNGKFLLAVENTNGGERFVKQSTPADVRSYVRDLYLRFGQEEVDAVAKHEFPTDFNNTDFQTALAESFLSFVIFQDPNMKLDPSSVLPEWKKYVEGESEMVFNRDEGCTGNSWC